jgi:hypothetical protein
MKNILKTAQQLLVRRYFKCKARYPCAILKGYLKIFNSKKMGEGKHIILFGNEFQTGSVN